MEETRERRVGVSKSFEAFEARIKALAPARALWLAYDHGLEHGPSDFNQWSMDPLRVVGELSALFDGVILNIGVARAAVEAGALKSALVLKATGRSNLALTQLQSQIAFVDEALELGAAAIAATVYIGEANEPQMIEQLALLREQCHRASLPLVGFMYPRGPRITNPSAPEVVAYAARIGMELGCDFVKTYWTGSAESFRRVVEAAPRTRLMVAGGPRAGARAALEMASQAVEAGATGLAIGRNVWLHENPIALAKALRAIVHEGKSVEEATKML